MSVPSAFWDLETSLSGRFFAMGLRPLRRPFFAMSFRRSLGTRLAASCRSAYARIGHEQPIRHSFLEMPDDRRPQL